MTRIRNVKPEFYRSDDIDALTWEQRFMFIALFSYVDDNGVGRDRESDICADLFAGDFSVDPTETLRKVRHCLLALVQRGLVVRYTVENRPYLYITGWDQHQYVKNPNRERYPRPDKALLTSSVDSTETLGKASVDAGAALPTVVSSGLLVVGSESWVDNTRSPAEILKAEFDGFWEHYPRKVNKAAAFKAYRTARKKVDMPTIAAAYRPFLEAMTRRAADKVPHASTWLNSEPWHDDPEAIQPTPSPARSPRQAETDGLFDRALQRAQQRDAELAAPSQKAVEA